MAHVEEIHPPGDYPVVIVGSGPGGVQMSYCLTRLGITHAVISEDDGPGGMFRRFPIFQRLISWTKPHAPVERDSREYFRFDWNSLIGDEDEHSALVSEFMDGTSYFPSRPEMERGVAAFVERAGVAIRYGCRWETTRRLDQGFVLTTSAGDYRCKVAIFAVGMARPWKPSIEGLNHVPHYVELKDPQSYAGRTILIIGKRNSGFELADGLLPWAKQITLASPRPVNISVLTHSIAAARARYMQPYEDHVFGGGNLVMDAAIERVERTGEGFRIHAAGTTRPGDHVLEFDHVFAATGFMVPLGDLPEIGVAAFYQGRLPAQTPLWESATVPGIYFAGTATQGAIGLKKYGIPSASSSLVGFRHNARVLARHIAEKHFGIKPTRPTMRAEDVIGYLLSEATRAPELWNQRSYLARMVSVSPDGSFANEGIVPLAHFADSRGPDAVAITVETDSGGDIHPAVYVRRKGEVDEHLLSSAPMHNYEGPDYVAQMKSLLSAMLT
jgi:thioredoxin reductase